MSSVGAATSTGREDPLPFLLTSAAPSRCMSSKLSDTANLSVNNETGSFELMGSGLNSISCLRKSSIGETAYAAKLSETVNLKVNTYASETGKFDSGCSRLESIPCLGKSFTNDATMVSPADAQASERIYRLAEIIGASKTVPGTLGLSALVVDAAPCDAGAMSEGLLATLVKDEDTEVEEAATPHDRGSLLGRAVVVDGSVTRRVNGTLVNWWRQRWMQLRET